MFVLRKDIEKAMSDEVLKKVAKTYADKGYEVKYTDTVLKYHVHSADRLRELGAMWKEFANSSLIITDRLHGMIFSVITNTLCVSLDNSNHKVRSTFEDWLSDYDYVKCLDCNCSVEELEKACEELLSQNRLLKYENKLTKHFNALKENINQE